MAGRDQNGRFTPGNKIAKGRPKRSTETEYLDALIDSVPLDKWQKIAQRAVTDAMSGDYRARQWLGEYIMGKPPQTLNISAADTALLSRVLKALEARNMSASAIFEAMLNELVAAENVEENES